ncbi:hypothetical protein [Shewanella xiamenensis]|uniref:hypothetical protein n=1 Tax=Shewanella xiamenensis TaxID=332186 RepID=UPI00211A31F3|nr:hypothetical protein [Shewanella xiamenensis]
MSAIANFKARREAEKRIKNKTAHPLDYTYARKNQSLIDAQVTLGGLVDEFIEKNNEIDRKPRLIEFNIGVYFDESEEKKAIFTITTDVKGNFISLIEHLDDKNNCDSNLAIDSAEGQDQTAQATVTTDDQGNIASIIEHAAELEDSAASVSNAAETALDAADKVSDSADKVSTAASDLELAASSVDDSASSLAYTAEDLGDIKNELKDVAAELKKPSAAPASSRGAKAAAPKRSSKK